MRKPSVFADYLKYKKEQLFFSCSFKKIFFRLNSEADGQNKIGVLSIDKSPVCKPCLK